MNVTLPKPSAGQHHNFGIHRIEDMDIVDARLRVAEWCDLGGARPRQRTTLLSKLNQVSPADADATKQDSTVPAEGREGADVAADGSDRSRDGDDDASSCLTSVTAELKLAARKTMIHAKAQRAVHASIPREVKEALLENAFPHVRTKVKSSRGSLDSTMAERSIDTSKTEPITRSSSEQSEAAQERGGDGIDYNDCIPTLSPREIAELRQALHNTEKERVQFMMEHLSKQSETYRELLEEHHTLQQRVDRAEKEKQASENKLSELEESFVEMKLQLANAKSREDHHKLSLAKYEMDLKAVREENEKLRRGVGTVPITGRRNSDSLTKSLSTAEAPDDNVRSGAPARRIAPLTRSWFGKDGFLDRSFRRADSKDSSNLGLSASFLDRCQENEEAVHIVTPQAHDDPPSPKKREVPARTRSFVNPTKARASNDSEFMPWGGPSEEQEVVKRRHHPVRSRSFVDPKKLSPIGSDIFLPFHPPRSADAPESRLTLLSNITDCTFEDGEDASGALEEARREMEALFQQSLFPKRVDADTPPPEDSRESRSTPPTFEPARSSDQQVLGLRDVSRTEQPPYECTNRLIRAVGMERDEFEGRLQTAASFRGMDGGRPRLQKAASLRGRNKNKASSSGDAFLAFC